MAGTTGPKLLSFALFCSMAAAFISGFITDRWYIFEDGNEEYGSIGLWKFCYPIRGCYSIFSLKGTAKPALEKSQAVMCIGLVIIAGQFAVYVAVCCKKVDIRIPAALGVLVGVCGMVSCLGKQAVNTLDLHERRSINGWGFYVVSISALFSFLNFLITVVWMCTIRRKEADGNEILTANAAPIDGAASTEAANVV